MSALLGEAVLWKFVDVMCGKCVSRGFRRSFGLLSEAVKNLLGSGTVSTFPAQNEELGESSKPQ